MVLLSTLVAVHSQRFIVPASLLSASMVPYASAAMVSGALSWVLPRRMWETLDNGLYRAYMRLCLFVFENISGVDLVASGDLEALLSSSKERALVISNHQSNADWAVIFMLAARHSKMGAVESLRFMIKHSIQYVPLFGWYIFQHGYIFIRRHSFDSAPVVRQLRWLDTLADPYWLLIFPEGTRHAPASLARSRAFREAKGLPPLERVLSPRSAGLRLSVDHLHSLEAVYDVTIAYSQTRSGSRPPGMFTFVCCPAGSSVHVHVRRFGRKEMDADTTGFLEERFREKEVLLSQYASTGSLVPSSSPSFPPSVLPTIPLSETAPSTAVFIAALAAPLVSNVAREIFKLTVEASPFLFLWLKVNKCV